MSQRASHLAGLLTFLPTLAIQILICRELIRRWPRFRKAFVVVTAIPFWVWILGYPPFNARFPDPVLFVVGFWLYAGVPAYLCYKLAEKLLTAAGRRVPSSPHRTDSGRRDLIRTAALATAAAPCAVLLYGTFIERTAFGVNEVVIPVRNLHPDLDGLRILQLSDVHRGAFLSQKLLTRVVDAARELNPELIAHTGDFISSKGDPIDDCLRELARLKGEAFGCLGNHEVYAEVESYATAQAANLGIRILRSESQVFRRGAALMSIAGVDYQRMGNRAHFLERERSLVAPGTFNLLLSHNPDVFPVAARLGFDLTLSGHTHGGQVRTEILHQDLDLARFYTPYVAGLYRNGDRACYVTRGIGTIGIPARVGAPPEITLIRLSRV